MRNFMILFAILSTVTHPLAATNSYDILGKLKTPWFNRNCNDDNQDRKKNIQIMFDQELYSEENRLQTFQALP